MCGGRGTFGGKSTLRGLANVGTFGLYDAVSGKGFGTTLSGLQGALTGALSGAGVGAMGGPWGAVQGAIGGAVIGGGLGLAAHETTRHESDMAQHRVDRAQQNAENAQREQVAAEARRTAEIQAAQEQDEQERQRRAEASFLTPGRAQGIAGVPGRRSQLGAS